MATPSLAMIPSAYADSKVYSVLPNNGDGDFTFNRDSSATRVGQNGLIQTVGFFGSEEITNGDFATDSDWTKGSTTTISGGQCTFTASGVAQSLIQSNLWTANSLSGKTVKLTYTIISNNLNVTLFRVGGFSSASGFPVTNLNSEVGTHTIQLVIISSGGTDNAIDFYIQSTATTGALVLDNVSVKEVTGDQPRLNYDISNGVVQSCPSLLLEPASTNLIDNSNFQTGWNLLSGGSLAYDQTVSPEGIQNASILSGDGINGNSIYDSISLSVQSYTFSVFAKQKDISVISLKGFSGGATGTSKFNLSNGTIDTASSGQFSDEKIEDYGNGWYRCSVKVTATSSGSKLLGFAGENSDSGELFSLYGAQLEALSYATSYIPTNGSSQTRAAETCFGAGTSSTFNSTEGVLYAEINALHNVNNFELISISDGSNSNRCSVFFNNSTLSASYRVSNSNIFLNLNNVDILQYHKIAISYKQNEFKVFLDGLKVFEQLSGNVAPQGTFNKLSFDRGDNGDPFLGNCKDLRVYNEALTDAQLQTLTTL